MKILASKRNHSAPVERHKLVSEPKPSAPRGNVRDWPDVHFRISPERYEQIVALAEAEERSVANFVSRLVRQRLDVINRGGK